MLAASLGNAESELEEITPRHRILFSFDILLNFMHLRLDLLVCNFLLLHWFLFNHRFAEYDLAGGFGPSL